ncbi:amidase [Roseomonas marmotae]|uniref:amidase n=1 Tax=Roseomonas marmotae TaxID=2768161 RepID=UPI001AD7833C|nr:amidase [Roseomonas marmotae]QTI78438.1 amidase [Roseomonas marmotae]
MSTNPADLSATEAARRIDAGSLRPETLLEACLDRIAEREPVVRAFVHFDPALARAAASRPLAGILAGLPVGVKDVLDTADQPSQYGSPIWQGHQPRADSYAVAATRRAGGIIMGKTVTTEFATRHPGPTTNPHNPSRTPGGSSSGSAAGVAAGFFPLALGTQTGGSVLRPAAFCGVTGFKPSFGLIHRAGMKVMSESLDTIGVFGRGVGDCALYAQALTGQDLGDPQRATGAAPRLAVCIGPAGDALPAATRRLLEDVADAASRAGARVTRLELPPGVMAGFEAHPVVMNAETLQALAWERMTHPRQISAVLTQNLDWAAGVPAPALAKARAAFASARAAFKDFMAGYDAILTPAALDEAPEGIGWTGDAICNALWTALHAPCISIPAGRGAAGMPVGVQLVAPYGEDRTLLGWAGWLEGVLGR